MGGVLGSEGFGKGEPEGFGNAFAIGGVGTVAVADMSLFDKDFRIAHCACRILASGSLVLGRHQSPQFARLRVVVAIEFALVVVVDLARDRQRRLFQVGLVVPLAIAIWLVAYRASSVIVGAHLTVAVVGVEWATRAIYWY